MKDIRFLWMYEHPSYETGKIYRGDLALGFTLDDEISDYPCLNEIFGVINSSNLYMELKSKGIMLTKYHLFYNPGRSHKSCYSLKQLKNICKRFEKDCLSVMNNEDIDESMIVGKPRSTWLKLNKEIERARYDFSSGIFDVQ